MDACRATRPVAKILSRTAYSSRDHGWTNRAEKSFDLRPDKKAMMLLAKLKQRNAESIFAAIANELATLEVDLLPATTFLEDSLAHCGLIAGPKLSLREQEDVELGWKVAKEIARLDIGQTVIVKNGTIVAVEGLEGTNEAIR